MQRLISLIGKMFFPIQSLSVFCLLLVLKEKDSNLARFVPLQEGFHRLLIYSEFQNLLKFYHSKPLLIHI